MLRFFRGVNAIAPTAGDAIATVDIHLQAGKKGREHAGTSSRRVTL
jgi:hypothetical protein